MKSTVCIIANTIEICKAYFTFFTNFVLSCPPGRAGSQFVPEGRWSNDTIGPSRLVAGSRSAYGIRFVGRAALPRRPGPEVCTGKHRQPPHRPPPSLRGRQAVAIRNPCGATRRPVPEGPERCGLPRSLTRPRNDVVIWWPVLLFGSGGHGGTARGPFPTVRISYAEREPATSREGPMV